MVVSRRVARVCLRGGVGALRRRLALILVRRNKIETIEVCVNWIMAFRDWTPMRRRTEKDVAFVHRAGTVPCVGFALLAPLFLLDDYAQAQTNFNADYAVTFARITVGNVGLSTDIGSNAYAMSASGRLGGAIRLLMNGEAHLTARGTIDDAGLRPASFVFAIISPDDSLDVNMSMENGNVTELTVLPPTSGGVPIRDADRQGILDPLSALLIPGQDVDGALSKEACQRTLPIFDGRDRYDLQLSFKRFDKIAINKGYAGPVVVCSVGYRPIAGHHASTQLVKYLAESREIEGTFAPIAGTRLLAPIRLLVTSLLANLVVQANRFEVISQTPLPSNSKPN